MKKRKNIRLTGWDYSSKRAYHVTLCSRNRSCDFGSIIADEDGIFPGESPQRDRVELTDIGSLVEESLHDACDMFPDVHVSNYVIMPNHVHVLLWLEDDGKTSLGTFVGKVKAGATKAVHEIYPGKSVWQRGYHDHIIRGDSDFQKVWEYIENNPGKWIEDEYYKAWG